MKFLDRVLIVLAAALILVQSVLLFLSPQQAFSDAENRMLTTFHAPKFSDWLDGRFADRFGAFCTDQFPFRTQLIQLKARTEKWLGKSENNGILFGKDDFLFPRGDDEQSTLVRQNLDAVRRFIDNCQTPCTFFAVPRKIDVLSELLPNGFDTAKAEQIRAALPLGDDTFPLLFPAEPFRNRPELFFKTDHHWTALGAYEAYRMLGDALNYCPKELSDFTEETVCDDFFGSADTACGGIGTAGDFLRLYRYAGDDRICVRNEETGAISYGFYSFSALNGKDRYRVFLNGNHARLHVFSPTDESKPHLLLIKDSYANCLIPFLAQHYQLTVLDLRYGNTLPEALQNPDCYDRVLFLQGLDTLASDASLQKLNLVSFP